MSYWNSRRRGSITRYNNSNMVIALLKRMDAAKVVAEPKQAVGRPRKVRI